MVREVEIAGAGPAGLSAALAVVKGGGQATVYEAGGEVGSRFHGDFQGLENWTTTGDVLEELASLGIEPSFRHQGFHECVFFDAEGRDYSCRTTSPLFYLVCRGQEQGSLDQALKQQAIAAGVSLRLNTPCLHLPVGGIVAHGPHRVDAVATGFVFETDCADGAYAAVGDRLAPEGYAYLLVWNGRGTIAACQFTDFHNSREYVERTVDFFRGKVGIRMTNPRPFGGFGNLYTGLAVRKGQLLYVGEAAGFQDALFGFGLRYALRSGHLAARAWLDGCPERYDFFCREQFGKQLKLAVVNRYLYGKFGERGYGWLLRTLRSARDPRAWLGRYYSSGSLRLLGYPFVRRRMRKKMDLIAGCKEGCDCTWCRCQHALQVKGNFPIGCQPQTGGDP